MRSQRYTLVPGVTTGDQRQERINTSLGFLATGLIINNNSPNWWLEPSSNAVIPPGSINQVIVLPGGSAIATLLFQAPPGQTQPAASIPPGACVAQYVDDEGLKASYAPSYASLVSTTQLATQLALLQTALTPRVQYGTIALPGGALTYTSAAFAAVNTTRAGILHLGFDFTLPGAGQTTGVRLNFQDATHVQATVANGGIMGTVGFAVIDWP